MNTPSVKTALAALALSLCAVGLRAEAASDPSWTKAADNKIFAQTYVNETMAKNPDLAFLGVHTFLPGTKDQRIIACNLDRIGKKDDEDDIGAAEIGKITLEPKPTKGEYEVLVPLHDASGKNIGALGVVYKYKGEDPRKLLDKATKLRDEFAKKIKSADDLFKPAA